MNTSKTRVEIKETEISGPELAGVWRVDPATIRQYRREGMPGRKIGYRKFLYLLSTCNAWLEKREAQKESVRQQRREEAERAKRKTQPAGAEAIA